MAKQSEDSLLQKTPWGSRWLPFIPVVAAGFIAADLVILSYRDLMLPQQAPPSKPQKLDSTHFNQGGSYSFIVGRNIFSSDGIIPDPLELKDDPKKKKKPKEPIPTTLPLNLIGTLVHSNPAKSIAAIEIKGKNNILSYSPQKKIEELALVEKIERGKVFIRNIAQDQIEYLEMKSNNKVSFGTAPKIDVPKGDVRATGNNQYEINRKDLLKYTNDLSSILMQARCVPATRPGTGEIYGFRCLEIQQGSIYTQLGIKPMDVICGVNGSPVTSAQQAMELYSALKNSNQIELCIERDGRTQNFKYSITQ